jgi:hypothetical protein
MKIINIPVKAAEEADYQIKNGIIQRIFFVRTKFKVSNTSFLKSSLSFS